MKRKLSSSCMSLFSTFLIGTVFTGAVLAADPVVVKIDTTKPAEFMSPMIYGQFIEHLGRCINGQGIWAEMIEDRKFFYPIGDKESPWTVHCLKGQFTMDETEPFVGKHTPKLVLGDTPSQITLAQSGLRFKDKTKYKGYVWLKCSEGGKEITIGLSAQTDFPAKSFSYFESSPQPVPVQVGDYYKHSFEFEKVGYDGSLIISVKGTGTVHIGCVSLMPDDNVQGMRADVLELLKRLDSPIYRWPGGNFVSGYDWKDGIGDRDRRPPRKNPAWKGVEPNDFGINEFMTFCKLLKTEPYIAVNTGDGGVENALAELEYANGDATTPMGKLRAEQGHAEPYNVVWWGIGNEMYGNWQIGHMPVEKYVEKNNEFVDAFRKKDPKVKTIAVGNVGKWDEAFLPGAAKHMDALSEHFYCGEKKENVTDHAWQIPRSIRRIAEAHRKYRKELAGFKDVDPPIRVAMDEWNFWYGEHVFGELGTRYFMKDALGIAAGIHEFARQSDIYLMANYAQTVNVIGCIKTSQTGAVMETTGLVLELYRKYFGNLPVKTELAKPEKSPIDVQAALCAEGVEYDKNVYELNISYGGPPKSVQIPLGSEKNIPVGVKAFTIGIVNTGADEAVVQLDMKGITIPDKPWFKAEIADPESNPQGFNDPDKTPRITIRTRTVENMFDGTVLVEPYSVTVLKFDVE